MASRQSKALRAAALATAASAATLCLLACARSAQPPPNSSRLVDNGRSVPRRLPDPAAATRAARQFGRDYLRLTAGTAATPPLRYADPALRHRLDRIAFPATPLAQSGNPRFTDLTLSPSGRQTALALATVRAPRTPPFHLALRLRLEQGGWRVTAIVGP